MSVCGYGHISAAALESKIACAISLGAGVRLLGAAGSGCWDLSSGPLEEQQMCITTELLIQLLESHSKVIFFSKDTSQAY